MLASCETVNVNGREVSTVKIGNLEVMTEDLTPTNWDVAMNVCKNLGDGWRLPTKDELNVLYENKDKIGGFSNYFYWSSTEYANPLAAWGLNFCCDDQYYDGKNDYNKVRAVRAF